ncbi:MAG TPA: LysR family transcriptional regulator [Caulobacteraceae bacterium]|jgi:molybdate transport system regulatory protein|nr:LysR family transcriptional regulator [Caulobacteraceae bacterium]
MLRTGPLKIKLQLFVGDERAFGPGRADILAAIDREGSISAAGRSLGMSYRYAWMLVESMNHCFVEKLVEAAPGGRRGGGAVLTDTGRRVLQAYRALEQRVVANAQGDELEQLGKLLKPAASPDQDNRES